MDTAETRRVLSSLEVRPNKVLGQNFLTDSGVVDRIVELADVQSGDRVLEVGGGLGVLTQALAAVAGNLEIVEVDRRLAAHLEKVFAEQDHVSVTRGDALKIVDELLARGVDRVVSNLPYSVGSRILVDMIRSEIAPAHMLVMVQKEVANRLAAASGSKTYGVISIWSQMKYDVEVPELIPPDAFWPPPDVDSALVRFVKLDRPRVELRDVDVFYDVTRHAFQYRRKQLAGIMKGAPGKLKVPQERMLEELDRMNVDRRIRPEGLTVEEWGTLCNSLYA